MDPKNPPAVPAADPLRAAYERALTSNPAATAPEIVRAYHQRELSEVVSRVLSSLPAHSGALIEATETSAKDVVAAAEAAAARLVTHTAREVRNGAIVVLLLGTGLQLAFWALVFFTT